jgi:hypothetical protein
MFFLFIPQPIFAQTSAATALPQKSASQSGAVQLVGQMVQAEPAAQTQDRTHWSYEELKQTDGKQEELRDVVETKDCSVNRLEAVAGKPLTPTQRKKEAARIAQLASNPDEMQKSRKAAQADAQHERGLDEVAAGGVLVSGRRHGREFEKGNVPAESEFSCTESHGGGLSPYAGDHLD